MNKALFDDISDMDAARYEAAKRIGDATAVMDLLHPSSTAPMWRVCESFGVRADGPHGHWKKPTMWSRLFGALRG